MDITFSERIESSLEKGARIVAMLLHFHADRLHQVFFADKPDRWENAINLLDHILNEKEISKKNFLYTFEFADGAKQVIESMLDGFENREEGKIIIRDSVILNLENHITRGDQNG